MLLLSDLTDPASSPAIKCYCFTQTTRTEHEKKVRWQRSSPPLTTVSFRQTNFVLEHNVLNDTGSVPEGKALTCPPPPAPWQSAKIAHSHQLRLRLQAAGRRKTIGSWVQSTSIGCWLQQQRQEGWGGGGIWCRKPVSQYRLSEPVSSSPRDFQWLSNTGPKTSKEWHSTKVT